MNDDNGSEHGRARSSSYPYRYAEQYSPPEPERVSDVAITTFEHLYEVDPRLMQRWVLQQTFPNWDSLRIMASRHDHLDWMHSHFASSVVTGSELLAEVDADSDADVASESGSTPDPSTDGDPPSTVHDQEAPR